MSASEGAALPGPPDDGDEQPLLSLDEIVMQEVASNDEWAYRQADRLRAAMPDRVGGPDRRTEGEVFDQPTLLTLHKFLVHGVLKSLDFPVATGKEANVFRGTTPRGGYVAVKIYRINTATFKHVLKYIQGDERFEGVTGDKRGLVHAWCQKEFRNLARLRDAGVMVPEPIKATSNVLVTEYLGTKQGPWPRLQELRDLPDPQRLYDQLVEQYLLAYNKADLIHADLSEYNVLVANADQPANKWEARIIDVGQAVLKSHPMAAEFIERDLRNLANYFRRKGVDADPLAIRARLVHERARDSEPKALAGRGRRSRRPWSEGGEEEE
ncbi:MAG: kinase 1 [Thermoplasmata archaeon]|jgi:RIO kinase 1|nr:kinase 1 [Thermoplasmata archaeon]